MDEKGKKKGRGGGIGGVNKGKCAECKEDVKDLDKGVECDICQTWVHIKCGKLSNAFYGELQDVIKAGGGQGLKFLCISCDQFYEGIKVDIRQLIEKQRELETKQETLTKGLDSVKREIDEMKDSIKKIEEERNLEKDVKQNDVKVVEEIGDLKTQLTDLKAKCLYSDATRVQGAEATVVFTAQQSSTSKDFEIQVSELFERDKRKNNLVIFGIDETNDETLTKTKINDIIHVLGVDVNKVKYFGRVGRVVTPGKARVVRVVCDDSEVRRSILKGSNRLRGLEGYERTYISPDLTKSQQELDKKLRDNLKNLRIQYKDAKINNGEIIIVEHGTRTVLYPKEEN